MGILNCTPDSFHAGGRTMHVQAAVDHALAMVQQGADIIDVGGESTRPGAQRVDAAEQIRRVVPVISSIRAQSPVPISIDTTLASVAEAALQAGACMSNDVSAGTEDAGMLPLVARMGASVVLMHRLTTPDRDRYSHQYETAPSYADVVTDVAVHLAQRARAAMDAGVPAQRVVLDPGFGFGKSVAQNFELLHRLRQITAMDHPVLVGVSRKSFLGAATGDADPSTRLPATLAAGLAAMQAGAAILRVHDVAPHAQIRAVFRSMQGC
jgi:dihydropteroate synthase